MVTVVFYNLLRSKYNIHETVVQEGTIHDIIAEIIQKHPSFSMSDFKTCVVFHEHKAIHYRQFDTIIKDNERIIMTHFVGGG